MSGDFMMDTITVPPDETPSTPPSLGGWLVCPALHLVVSPLVFLASASTTNATIATLVQNGRIAQHPQGDIFQLVTWALRVAYLILTVTAAIHFFRRSRKTPKIMQAWYLTGIIIALIAVPYTAYSLGLGFDTSGLGQSLGWALCWLIYFSTSKRVKSTFIADIGNCYIDRAAFTAVAIIVIAASIALPVAGQLSEDKTGIVNDGANATFSPVSATVQDRWPQVFSITDTNNVPQASADDMSSGDKVMEDMANTYGFCVGQEWSVRGLEARFPQYAQQLASAQADFDMRYKDSEENIDQILEQKLPEDWDKQRRKIQETLQTQVDFNSVTESDATDFLQKVKDRR
jgi:uncharacterized protein DUF2569